MKRLAQLIEELNATTRTNDKRDAIVRFLQDATDADKVWLIAMFTHRRPRRLVNTTLIRQWCMEVTGLPNWLFDEAYHHTGDLSEAMALMLPEQDGSLDVPFSDVMQEVVRLQAATEDQKKQFVLHYWNGLNQSTCYVFHKLIVGSFRSGVSENLMIQALATFTGKDVQTVAHLISGNWNPATTRFSELLHDEHKSADASKPYPFYLAYALEQQVSELGAVDDWQIEWKWDGIRGQLVRRSGQIHLWSRGEELITEKFPEIQAINALLPDGTVLDGEILTWKEGHPLAFQTLQTRVTRKNVTKKQLAEAPVAFMCYDLLEWAGEDYRSKPLSERREQLHCFITSLHQSILVLSPTIHVAEWRELDELIMTSRERGCEGFMLKRKNSVYQAGRRRGDWWKWKVQPLTVDAVMIYAQKGSGKRSSLYTDYTFAVKDGEKLVPFAKAYSGLADKEIAVVDKFIKANSIEQFGPVRTVRPELVFEIAFEGIAASPRHKSGVAVSFPRILRQRTDKSPEEVNTLEDLQQLLQHYGK